MMRPTEIVRAYRSQRRPMTFARASAYGFLVLVVVSWGYILVGTESGISDVVAGKTWSNAAQFLRQLLGLGADVRPAYLQADQWVETGKLAYQTLAMSVLAISIAGIGAFLTFIPGARNMSNGELSGAPSRSGSVLYYIIRWAFALTRAVPELVWALVIVFFLSPGILPGAVALGLHNFGVVGKLSSEAVENMETAPARALRFSGASNSQILLYSVIPQTLPQLLTYWLYRWEVVIRTTVVVGSVSGGGLGRELRLNLSFFHYTDAAQMINWHLLLVIAVDFTAAWLRRLGRFD